MPSSGSAAGAASNKGGGQAPQDNKTLPPKENALFKRILVRYRRMPCTIAAL